MQWRFCIIGILLGLFSGCNSQKPALEVTYTAQERRQAMEFALTENRVLQALVNQCQVIDDKNRLLAQQAQQTWWEKNWPWVAAADAEITETTRQQQARLGSITGQLLLIRFMFLVEKHSVYDKQQEIIKSTRPEQACAFKLAAYSQGKKDLANSPYAAVLAELARQYPQTDSSTPHEVPQINYGFKAESNVGSSLFQVEKLARDTLCTTPDLLNIFNRWPREMYGAYCEGKDPSLIVCEWTECTIISGQ